MKLPVLGLLFAALGSTSLFGQASPTASRTFDLQVGGGFVLDHSDYEPEAYKGGALYSTLDFTSHFGAEIDFRSASSSVDKAYERTYEIGGRYHRQYGRFEPYAKALYGRGVYNFSATILNPDGTRTTVTVANLAYNEFSFGGGVDYHLLRFLNIRGDYEYQDWHGFPAHGLTPQVVTIGVAYHFPGGLPRGLHWR